MAFMEPQVEYGHWYEVDGPAGTEWVPAELVGEVTNTHADGRREKRFPTLDELQEFDRVTEDEDERESVRFPIPSALADYCENREAWSIKLIEGWGARMHAPGYLDCTDWCVFESEREAREYLTEHYLDEQGADDE